MKTVLVVGVFDLFHRGHVELLEKSALLGDKLVVIVNGDEFTEKYKRKPIFCEDDRLNIIKSCRYVDAAEISNSPDVKPYVEKYGVNIIVHGNDWEHNSYLKQICLTDKYIEEKGIELVYTDYYTGISTSKIIDKLREKNEN